MPLTNWTRGWGFTEDVVISHRRDLILSVLVRAKLVRIRRVVENLAAARWPFSSKSFPFRLSRDYRSEIRDEFGLMAENKLLFLEFPRERFPYSESTPV